ncbi:complement C2 [Salarias fasciatus]|uniref:complement C2 n=1 Tax=Salarias fasciatus TaxID=181472 RepID=UPI0011768238|nr:complement C2-like [Salarias fasciatus]
MPVTLILWILLFFSVGEDCEAASLQDYDYTYEDGDYEDPQPLNCSVAESIKGGRVSFSQGGLQGSVLTYHCAPSQYPFPVSYRVCEASGDWSPMRLASGRLVSRATCKDVLCPAQLQLDHGEFWPRDQWFRVGMTQSFSCQEGFTLEGSAQRNCTLSGEWTGHTPVCSHHDPADDCNDPGIPPGAQRTAGHFHLGEKLTYWCQTGLDLLGSAERICLKNREWSGSTPRCQGPNTFDSPSSVAASIAGSFAGVMDVLSPDAKKKSEDESFGRAFRVADVGRMHVYILLDTSGSIKKDDFELSRNATAALIRKLDSYDVQMNFHVLSFASKTRDIVNITDTETSGNVDDVLWYLTEFDYRSHGRKTGTNLYEALYRVLEMMSIFKQNRHTNHFNETQNIIIIETDGYSNTGSKPLLALRQIRKLLGYNHTAQYHTHETMLDVYVFGVGENVNRAELDALASKKSDEQHFFVLKNFEVLGNVFNSIISDESVTMCGIAQESITEEERKEGVKANTEPWHVTLQSPEWGPEKKCRGSIVSQNWVLTAAHCFAKVSSGRVAKDVSIEYGDGSLKVNKVIMHPEYNTYALQHRNVSEFYDYDVALVQLKESIPLSRSARPICLPCTIPATRAMKKINSTCEEHRKELLGHQTTPAFFIHNKQERKATHIHLDNQRAACVEKARQTLDHPTDVTLNEYVTDRFLCSGGTAGYQDAVTCKGDSGGSLFLQKRLRYFQVGVVSWGITDTCAPKSGSKMYSNNRPPPDARDFHIDIFKIMPWLKQHLGQEIQFLPDIH